jgi:hypothetical protein
MYVHSVRVSYDDQAGVVRIEAEVFDPAQWHGLLDRLPFSLGPSCNTPEFSGEVAAREGEPGEGPAFRGLATLKGYEGSTAATGSFDAHFTKFEFQNAAFVSRNWRCATVTFSGEDEHFKLDGWPVIVVTAASKHLVGVLTKAANAHHTIGFDSRRMWLRKVKVTNNGWAIGTPVAKNPKDRGNGVIIFRFAHNHWRAYIGGSAFPHSNIPAEVLEALYQ